MQLYVTVSLKSLLDVLNKVHCCEKGQQTASKISFKNNGKILYCEDCALTIDSSCFKNSYDCQSFSEDSDLHRSIFPYEEVICIEENLETNEIEGIAELSSVKSTVVDSSNSLLTSQVIDEKDPLSIESCDLKLLEYKAGPTSQKPFGATNGGRIIPKIVDWTSDAIGIATENVSNKKQKYPTTLVCEYCGVVFEGKDRIYKLFYHRNKIHTKSKNFKCSICQRVYWGEREFLFHVSSHSSPGAVCEVCGIRFTRKQDLNRHVLIHNSKQFTCMFCPKQFNRKDNLKVHERIHTGHFPFICHMCGSGFPQKHQLKLHDRKCLFSKTEKTGSLS